jgi:hypothetical protein
MPVLNLMMDKCLYTQLPAERNIQTGIGDVGISTSYLAA